MDRDAALVRLLITALGARYATEAANSTSAAVERLAASDFDALIAGLDHEPDLDWLWLARAMQGNLRCVVTTAGGLPQAGVEMLRDAGIPVLAKPFKVATLLQVMADLEKPD